jgi:V/A-type H+-transporting ATPase subunit I
MFFLIQIVVLRRDAASSILPDAVPWGVSLMEGGVALVAAGLVLVAFFAEQDGRFLRGVGLGFARLPIKALDTIGAFSDVVSYIRLFAVGLATVKVAESFNQMAAEVGFGLPTGLIAAFILFLGHTLNIAMGTLSIVVHGVRLNVLEFSSHLGMEWTGIPYQPFRIRERSGRQTP